MSETSCVYAKPAAFFAFSFSSLTLLNASRATKNLAKGVGNEFNAPLLSVFCSITSSRCSAVKATSSFVQTVPDVPLSTMLRSIRAISYFSIFFV